jgi:hypothetical protein
LYFSGIAVANEEAERAMGDVPAQEVAHPHVKGQQEPTCLVEIKSTSLLERTKQLSEHDVNHNSVGMSDCLVARHSALQM